MEITVVQMRQKREFINKHVGTYNIHLRMCTQVQKYANILLSSPFCGGYFALFANSLPLAKFAHDCLDRGHLLSKRCAQTYPSRSCLRALSKGRLALGVDGFPDRVVDRVLHWGEARQALDTPY